MGRALWLNLLDGSRPTLADERGKPRTKKGRYGYGCNGCPLDKRFGIHKLLGHDRIEQRYAMLFGLSPGRDENNQGLEFVGKAGRMLWEEFGKIGLTREMFDVQNVVRCRPTKKAGNFILDRDPTKEEIAHCSAHTETALALNGGAAKLYVVFGKVAAEALLGQEYRKDRPIFWSKKLDAKVFCMLHPSYFVRGNFPEWRFETWVKQAKAVKSCLDHPGRYGWVKAQKFYTITKPNGALQLYKKLRSMAKKGVRVSVDIETTPAIEGDEKLLCVGFSWAKDRAATIVLDHKENKATPSQKAGVRKILRKILADSTIEKVFHYGSFDVDELVALLAVQTEGYYFDTIYASFLKASFQKKHGLDAISIRDYPEYAGYKDLVSGYSNYGEIPLRILALYNCADAALTKRIEIDTIDNETVDKALLRTYTRAGFTLDRMESRGPVLDEVHFKEVASVIPQKLESIVEEMRLIADDPNFNPKATEQIATVLYDRLGFEDISLESVRDDRRGGKKKEEKGRSTRAEILDLLHQKYKHPFPVLVKKFRRFEKMESTYLSNYKRSADMNGGELRTKWFLTGAATGRLRSGGSKEGEDGKVNFQNLHGSPYLQNLLVSDSEWRTVLNRGLWRNLPDELLDIDVFLALDYSQIEVRMLAESSGDPLLIQQFQEASQRSDPSDPKADIHCLVGNLLNPQWSLEFIKKTKEIRTFVKNCHFGMIFGLSPEGLYFYLKAMGVKTTPAKVADFHQKYFRKYRMVARYIDRQRAFAEKHGFVESIFHFRRMIGGDDERDTNPANQAINTPIQGAAHTFLICAMALLKLAPNQLNRLNRPIMEVHDALVWRVKLRHLPEAYRQAKFLLEKGVPQYVKRTFGRDLKVPLLSEATAGFRYGAMPDYKGEKIVPFLQEWSKKNEKVDAEMAEEYELAA